MDLTVFDDGRPHPDLDPTASARIWEAATGRPIGPPDRSLGLSETRSSRPTAGGLLTGGEDGLARLWDVATAATRRAGPAARRRRAIARFSPDGRLIATGERGWGGMALGRGHRPPDRRTAAA